MAQGDIEPTGKTRNRQPHHATLSFEAGPVRSRAEVSITTGGLLAIGALVSGIILSVAPLVWTATSVARKRAERGEKLH